MKKYLTPSAIGECKSKSQLDITSHLLELLKAKATYLAGWLLPEKQEITDAGDDVEKLETFHNFSWTLKWGNFYGKQYGDPSKKLKTGLP